MLFSASCIPISLISDIEGAKLVSLARKAVEGYLETGTFTTSGENTEKMGLFVTLHYRSRNGEHLRGCIGFPQAEKELHQSVVEAAIAAATEDPRFPPVDKKELHNIIFEVSILTPPEEIKIGPSSAKEIKVGRDGLMLRWRHGSGLLLPQVAVELKWDIDEYLANICHKAGAPADAWLDPSSRLYRFQAVVFKELEPRGKVARVEL